MTGIPRDKALSGLTLTETERRAREAIPDSLGADLRADALRGYNPNRTYSPTRDTVRPLGAGYVTIAGNPNPRIGPENFREPAPLVPAGRDREIAIMDAMMDQQDALDRAELAKRLVSAGDATAKAKAAEFWAAEDARREAERKAQGETLAEKFTRQARGEE